MQISRIRLSDKTSRLHPRRVASKRSQTYEPVVEGIDRMYLNVFVPHIRHMSG